MANFAARNNTQRMQFLFVRGRASSMESLERTSANNVRKREVFKFKSSSGRIEFKILKGTNAQNTDVSKKKKTEQSYDISHEIIYSPLILCKCENFS